MVLAVLCVSGAVAVFQLSLNHLTLINDSERAIEQLFIILHPFDFPFSANVREPGQSLSTSFPALRFSGSVTVYGQFDEENEIFGYTEPEDYHRRLTVRIHSDGSVTSESR